MRKKHEDEGRQCVKAGRTLSSSKSSASVGPWSYSSVRPSLNGDAGSRSLRSYSGERPPARPRASSPVGRPYNPAEGGGEGAAAAGRDEDAAG